MKNKKDTPLEGMSDMLIVNTTGSKRFRDEINLKYMWCLRLGHVGEDRTNRLKKDRLLGQLSCIQFVNPVLFKKK